MGGWLAGWLETDNRAISVQLNLTGTATGTELGKIASTDCMPMLVPIIHNMFIFEPD